jgi:sec-independent protein translocase protein TatB
MFFGVSFWDLMVIAFVAMLVFGPDRLPEIARQAGRLVRQMRTYANSARDELRAELGPAYADLELRDLDPRVIARKHIAEAMAELDAAEEAARYAASRLGEGEVPPYDVDAT